MNGAFCITTKGFLKVYVTPLLLRGISQQSTKLYTDACDKMRILKANFIFMTDISDPVNSVTICAVLHNYGNPTKLLRLLGHTLFDPLSQNVFQN